MMKGKLPVLPVNTEISSIGRELWSCGVRVEINTSSSETQSLKKQCCMYFIQFLVISGRRVNLLTVTSSSWKQKSEIILLN